MEQPVANADYPTELDHSRALDFPEGTINPCTRKTTRVFRSISNNTTTEINNVLVPNNQSSRAYLLVRLLRDTLFGRVHNVRVLRRRTAAVPADGQADWEITDEQCVIQEMEWATIQESRGRRADDPIKYFSAMQYLHDRMQLAGDDANNGRDYVIHSVDKLTDGICLFLVLPFYNGGELFDRIAASQICNEVDARIAIRQILRAVDKLTDGICLFLVLPFFNGGELFDRIAAAERFTEGQARIYIRQILREIAVLQSAGICNCDISLENIMLHNVSCKIISLGMSLLIPYRTVKDGDVVIENDAENITHRGIGNASQVRLLLSPAGRKGNRLYMPPEIYNNVVPFDGFAVDLWAVGIMLFIMVTGFPPWDNPSLGDDKFRYMTGGFMVRLLTEWELGLSREVMDLLQKMLYRDPTERLCLQQILEHAWFNQD
eukprot:CAMPEP_0194446390 /NCGR_PEP_ID=MMETSP0176-20130528/128412_1 /TAXON_ID=216777 /ORGANISM="Proboscia alata, Strain PI-D3" /LENGTH=432 /DNA_ID=CAMNT_0039273095 /DNA_START=333 /DNA_END=1631 /DNA_ORIENTATION=+